jgi:hypothetical protein
MSNLETNMFMACVEELIASGVVGAEMCPEECYWHWPVLQADKLPKWLVNNHVNYGEIRYYWH